MTAARQIKTSVSGESRAGRLFRPSQHG